MRLGTVRINGRAPRFVGKIGNSDHVVDIVEAGRDLGLIDGTFPESLLELLQFGSYGERFIDELEEAVNRRGDLASAPWTAPLEDITFLAPVPKPGKIICINANRGNRISDALDPDIQDEWPHPSFFLKTSTAITGHRATVEGWKAMRPVEIEGEICLIIGRRARHVSASDVWSYVAGCSLLNDIAAGRFSLQDAAVLHISHGPGQPMEEMITRQMARAKGGDGFCPVGPWMVPVDELGMPFEDLEVITRREDDIVQRGVMSSQRFTPGQCIEAITKWITLDPGDIVSLGALDQMEEFPFRDVDLTRNGGETSVVSVTEPGGLEPLETKFVLVDP